MSTYPGGGPPIQQPATGKQSKRIEKAIRPFKPIIRRIARGRRR